MPEMSDAQQAILAEIERCAFAIRDTLDRGSFSPATMLIALRAVLVTTASATQQALPEYPAIREAYERLSGSEWPQLPRTAN
jgi:hypothetical protein